MALAPTEVVLEERRALRQLAQSPVWALLRTRWQQRALSNDKEKAVALRHNEVSKALMLQGFVDGLEYAVADVERALGERQEEAPLTPMY